jgi:hypothetical protein
VCPITDLTDKAEVPVGLVEDKVVTDHAKLLDLVVVDEDSKEVVVGEIDDLSELGRFR